VAGTAQPEAAATVVPIEDIEDEVPVEGVVPAEEEVKLQEEVGENGEAPPVEDEMVVVPGIYQYI
jgi:hypothetical protein